MSPWAVLALAAGAFRGHRRRTVLTLVGVSIGVAAVLVLTAVGEGARRYVTGQFSALGSNLLTVLPGKVETTGAIPGIGGVPNDLTIADAEALARGLPAARHVVPVVVGNDTVAHRERSRQAIVMGTTAEMMPVRGFEIAHGEFLPEGPWDRGSAVVVLGRTLAAELFPGERAVGRVVRIGSWRTRVIGVLHARGVHLGVDLDEAAFVPVATGMRMFDRSSLFRLLIEGRSGADLPALERRARAILVERHGEEDVTLLTQDAVVGSLSAILDVLTAVLAGIAAISLSVAGIGVMNVMLVSVSERRAEIGLLKALGAAPRQILALFVAEAVLLSAMGGALGLGAGLGLVRLAVGLWPEFPAAAPGWAVGAALGVSLAVGVLFGVLPARRAMRLDPVAALAGR